MPRFVVIVDGERAGGTPPETKTTQCCYDHHHASERSSNPCCCFVVDCDVIITRVLLCHVYSYDVMRYGRRRWRTEKQHTQVERWMSRFWVVVDDHARRSSSSCCCVTSSSPLSFREFADDANQGPVFVLESLIIGEEIVLLLLLVRQLLFHLS